MGSTGPKTEIRERVSGPIGPEVETLMERYRMGERIAVQLVDHHGQVPAVKEIVIQAAQAVLSVFNERIHGTRLN